MGRARALADEIALNGTPTYGLTTGLGVQKRTALAREDAGFDRRQIAESRAGQGPPAPPDVVRAAMLVLANQMAGGSTCLRPALAERLAQALNDGDRPVVRLRGSLGASDLAPMADLAHAVFGGVELVPGEGLALINSSAFGTGSAALALADAAGLVDAADVAGALALEGFAANLMVLHPAIERARPDPVLARTLARFRGLLEGSFLWAEGAARNLQDPLTYRSTAPIQATARRVLEHASSLLAIELNSAQGNPLVSVDDGRILSTSAYEVVGLAAALDYVRIGLATMLTAASERSVKLLDTAWSGLPTGLLAEGGPDLGLSILAITAESVSTEASLLAQPVSHALTSTSGAEGIEDRASQLPLSARRLAEMVEIGAGRDRHRAGRRRAGRRRARLLAARPRDRRGIRASAVGRASDEGWRFPARGRRPGLRADPEGRDRLSSCRVARRQAGAIRPSGPARGARPLDERVELAQGVRRRRVGARALP